MEVSAARDAALDLGRTEQQVASLHHPRIPNTAVGVQRRATVQEQSQGLIALDSVQRQRTSKHCLNGLVPIHLQSPLEPVVENYDLEAVVAAATMFTVGATALARVVAEFLLFLPFHLDNPFLSKRYPETLERSRKLDYYRLGVRIRTVYIETKWSGQSNGRTARGFFMPEASPDALVGTETVAIPAELDAFVNLAERWHLSTDEQLNLLGSPGRSTYFKWKKDGGSLPKDTRERISHLLAVFKALEILIPDSNSADEWVRRENEYFKGQTALDVMLGGFSGIYRVRQYVDAQRGG
jgi:hypothetical protein